ncbi:hypothetical protein LPJ53_003766 [Coemansia erecta]|uniref:Cerato-platanin-domain-containing protein n=1 Tax=Coemansia erecta TaxID=147472 RepID=A0A9W7Y1C8_9FUNG|nr:hypothetical protein LPJ53_003766 [Coemansia erecta]
MFRSALLAAALLATSAMANLTGSGTITYHDYQAIPLDQLKYNPPSCGMPYADLDLTRITAVQTMNTVTDCGQCIKVANSNDPSKYVYVLAVDTGGRGLDLSKPSFGKLFNIDDGVGPATWGPVDNSNCVGIWAGMGAGAYDGSKVPAPAASEEPAVVASSSQQAATSVQSVAPVSSSSSVLSTSIAIHLSSTKPPATSAHSTAPPVTIRSTEPVSSSSSAAAAVVSHENSAASGSNSSSSSLGSDSSQEDKGDAVVDMAYELGATPEESLSGVGHNAKDDLSSDDESSKEDSSSADEESDADDDSSSDASALGIPVPIAVLSVLLAAALL